MQRLQEIRDRADKATAGPWELTGKDEFPGTINGPTGFSDEYGPVDGKLEVWGKGNAEFIAHARQDIPYLLDALEQSQTENKQLKQPKEQTETLITIDDLACRCGYYRHIEEGDGYGCFHPLGEDHDNEGHCRTYGCPIAIEADIEDLKRLDNHLYEEYKNDAMDDGGIESEWMVWRGETAQSYKDMLIKLQQSQNRERVLREALEQALHGLTTSHNLFATDRPDIMREKCPENIFWMTDNSKEVESVLKALKQEVIT